MSLARHNIFYKKNSTLYGIEGACFLYYAGKRGSFLFLSLIIKIGGLSCISPENGGSILYLLASKMGLCLAEPTHTSSQRGCLQVLYSHLKLLVYMIQYSMDTMVSNPGKGSPAGWGQIISVSGVKR